MCLKKSVFPCFKFEDLLAVQKFFSPTLFILHRHMMLSTTLSACASGNAAAVDVLPDVDDDEIGVHYVASDSSSPNTSRDSPMDSDNALRASLLQCTHSLLQELTSFTRSRVRHNVFDALPVPPVDEQGVEPDAVLRLFRPKHMELDDDTLFLPELLPIAFSASVDGPSISSVAAATSTSSPVPYPHGTIDWVGMARDAYVCTLNEKGTMEMVNLHDHTKEITLHHVTNLQQNLRSIVNTHAKNLAAEEQQQQQQQRPDVEVASSNRRGGRKRQRSPILGSVSASSNDASILNATAAAASSSSQTTTTLTHSGAVAFVQSIRDTIVAEQSLFIPNIAALQQLPPLFIKAKRILMRCIAAAQQSQGIDANELMFDEPLRHDMHPISRLVSGFGVQGLQLYVKHGLCVTPLHDELGWSRALNYMTRKSRGVALWIGVSVHDLSVHLSKNEIKQLMTDPDLTQLLHKLHSNRIPCSYRLQTPGTAVMSPCGNGAAHFVVTIGTYVEQLAINLSTTAKSIEHGLQFWRGVPDMESNSFLATYRVLPLLYLQRHGMCLGLDKEAAKLSALLHWAASVDRVQQIQVIRYSTDTAVDGSRFLCDCCNKPIQTTRIAGLCFVCYASKRGFPHPPDERLR